MKKYKWIIILLNLTILLVYFNYSVGKKEQLLNNGQLILLELAPVDPRSLMQGDYMTLRYAISENMNFEHMPKRGYCVVQIDSNGVGKKVRFQQDITPLNKGERVIKYTSSDNWRVNIGAESFFFQEGEADKYSQAKYGAIKTDNDGNSLLIGLYNEKLKKIQ